MSTLKVNNLQVGQDGTAANNYTLYQPASPDGTVRLGYGVAGSVTDILTLKNSRLGIGTDNPQRKLVVSDNGTEGLEFFPGDSVNGSTINVYNRATASFTPFSLNAQDYRFNPNGGTEALRITSGGRVGINSISPSYKLHIKETTTASNYAFVENTTAGNAGVRLKNSQGDFAIFVSPDLRFYDLANSIDRLRITNTGKVGIGVNPAAWHSAASSNVIQVGSSVLFDYSAAQFDVGHNYYYDGSNYKFISTGYAERITFSKSDGSIRFWSLGTGSADATATVTEKLRITVDGDMGLGNVGGFSPGADPAVGNSATVFEIRQTTGTNLAGGNNRRGAVLRLKHEAQWENGYQNSASDDLGRVEFVTGDASVGEGVRSIIRCRNLQYYNDQALTFEVAEANSSTMVERLRISSDGDIGISDSAPTRKLSINGSMNLASGSRIESYSSGGNLIIQGGSTYPGGHLKMYGGTSDDKIEFCTTGASASSTVRFRLESNGSIRLTPEGSTANPNARIDTSGDYLRLVTMKDGSGGCGFKLETQDGGAVGERFTIESNGKVRHSGGHGNNGGNLGGSAYYRIVASNTVSASSSRTFEFTGLASGWMTIRGGGYSNAGQSQFAVMYQLGGYMTATSTYNVTTLQQWGSGVTISITKNSSNFRVTLTNNSGSYGLATNWCIESSNSGIRIAY